MESSEISQRFRRFLPVVVDIETGGLDHQKAPIVEIALYFLKMENSHLCLDNYLHFHIKPFEGSKIEAESIEFIGYKSEQIPHKEEEHSAFSSICRTIKQRVIDENCTRAILVGHNAHFDLSFFNAAMKRCQLKSPFHEFSTIDTVSISALLLGHTVLCQACKIANIEWDSQQAHSALYDCEKTATLFCQGVNQMNALYQQNTNN